MLWRMLSLKCAPFCRANSRCNRPFGVRTPRRRIAASSPYSHEDVFRQFISDIEAFRSEVERDYPGQMRVMISANLQEFHDSALSEYHVFEKTRVYCLSFDVCIKDLRRICLLRGKSFAYMFSTTAVVSPPKRNMLPNVCPDRVNCIVAMTLRVW